MNRLRFPLICAGLAGLVAATTLLAWTAASPDMFQTPDGPVSITPIRHASFTIEAGGRIIYVDPSPKELFAGRTKAGLILITDIHGDHMDPGAIAELKNESTKIIAPAAVAKTVTEAQVLSNGEHTTWGGWQIEAVPMYNLKRGPAEGKLYHDKGRGNGYILTFGGKRFYIAGDTEGIPEMRALKNIDVAFIPMNLPYTMPPDEAADAVKAFHPAVVYPYHFRGSDTKQFVAALQGTGIDVRIRDWYN